VHGASIGAAAGGAQASAADAAGGHARQVTILSSPRRACSCPASVPAVFEPPSAHWHAVHSLKMCLWLAPGCVICSAGAS
jgi:hypothetical protein